MVLIKNIIIFLLLSYSSISTAITVNAGEDFYYSFSNLVYLEAVTNSNQGSVSFNLAGDLLDVGESFRLELFEDSLSDTALFSSVFNSPLSGFGVGILSPEPWQDLQGVFRLSMLSGSINLDSFSIRVIKDGARYIESVNVSAVPIPAAAWLFGSALLGFFGFSRRKANA